MTANEKIIPISADSHVVEPTNCYRDHIESRYKDIAPYIGRVDRATLAPMLSAMALGALAGVGADVESPLQASP